jgi:hypothetical protein
MKIFISYSSKDNYILKCFVDRILKLGLQISPENICCTGIESSKPQTGEDFKEWIKKNIENSQIIIQIISLNYKSSEVCLNEMGASWLSNARIIPIIIPPLDYGSVGFMHNYSQLLKLNSKSDLCKLADEIMVLLPEKSLKLELLNSQIDEFLKQTSEQGMFTNDLIIGKKEAINTPSFEIFDKMLIEDIDIKSILLKSQPNLSDCIKAFKQEYKTKFYDYYSKCFKGLNNNMDLSHFETFEVDSADYFELMENNHNLPGGMTQLAKQDILNKNIRFYTVRFKRENEEFGTSFTAWAFIENRWIFFPKPWHLLESLKEK